MIKNKILQGCVLAPLLSSNMVDKNLGLSARNFNYVYLYKNQVKIPPLTMQDDILGISNCEFKFKKIISFINTRANIMGLQFGRDKCQKMHVGKRHRNTYICSTGNIDVWRDVISKEDLNHDILEDDYIGKEDMKHVEKKTYLGHIIQNNGRNENNIKDKVDKAVGSVEKKISSINERPYGRHRYRAALLMRQGLMLGGMLTNAETWINITEADITKLTMPDTQLQRRLLSVSGNPSIYVFRTGCCPC